MKRSRKGLRRRYGRSHGDESFFNGYVGAALWSSNDESDESGGVPLDSNYDSSDLAPETRATMRADCAKFQAINRKLLVDAYNRGFSKSSAGHDFWLTRNGHGAGFWDRNLLDEGGLGDKLTAATKSFGGFNLYVGDDGKIYGSRG
jgi:hypothetical protein